MCRIAHALDLMEEGRRTVDRLEMSLVVLRYRHRVTESLIVTSVKGEEEGIAAAAVAHRDEEAVDADELVAQSRVAAVMAVGRDCQRVFERRDISGQLIFRIDRVVHRTVYALTGTEKTKYRGTGEEGDDTSHKR